MSAHRTIIGLPGDAVIVTDATAARELGCPVGTRAEIVGFVRTAYGRTDNHGLKPGVYGNPYFPRIRLPSGKEDTVFAHQLDLPAGQERRVVGREDLRLWDLPDSPFWEMDTVEAKGGRIAVVQSIDANALAGNPESKAFRCRMKSGERLNFSADELRLVERGKVWLRAQGVVLHFEDDGEMGAFYRAVGEYEETLNPATGNYAWSPEDAAEGLLQGEVHGFHGDGTPRPEANTHMIRYRDAEVGEAVRLHTLDLLGLSAAPAP